MAACSHGGLYKDARDYFPRMVGDHSVAPVVELWEDRTEWRSMPFPEDEIAWTALLNACSLHGDAERGARVAERVMDLDLDLDRGSNNSTFLVWNIRDWMATRIAFQVRNNIDFNPWKPPNAPARKPAEQKKIVSSSSSSNNNNKAPLKNMLTSPPGLGNFKPPKLGYGGGVPQKSISEDDKSAMLETVRSQSGEWHQRAKLIFELQQLGFTAESLYDVAMVSPHLQTTMVVAAKVYDSLVAAGATEELLSTFNDESQVSTLYELRILSNKQRKEAEWKSRWTEELARAIKQHERRADIREGFSHVPGDCFALLYYRAASESTVPEEKKTLAQEALKYAVSELAIQKITQLLAKA